MTTAKQRLRCIIRVVPILLGAVLWLSLQPARASTWNSVTVDNSTNITGKYLSMAADPAGKLHIGYLDTNSAFPILKYATNAGGTWVTENLQAYVSNIVNASTSTVYTPAGPRIMAYSNNLQTGQYKYQAVRKIVGDGWQLQDIAGGKFPNGMDQPPVSSVGTTTQTGAVQYQGFTFITYSDGNTLWYANERDMYYYPFEGAGAGSGNQSDLVIDSTGHAHVLYYNGTTGKLMYATSTSDDPMNPQFASTDISALFSLSSPVSNPAIAIDAGDTLHVCFLDAGFNVKYMNKPAEGSWSSPTTISSVLSSLGGYLSLKVDGAGGLHLAFYKNDGSASNKGYLYYKNRTTTGTWQADELIPEIGSSKNYGQYAALVVDQNNNVGIAYYDVQRSKLCVAQKVAPAINASPAPVYYGNVLQGSALTKTVTVTNKGNSNLTLNGTPSLSGADSSLFNIDSNTCISGTVLAAGSGSCSITVSFSPTSSGARTASLNIGSNDPVSPIKSVELRGTSYSPADSFTINATTGVGGTITPSGDVSVTGGSNQTFTITPGPGYLVGSVMIDGTTKAGAVISYIFNEVSANRTISVEFVPITPVTMWAIDEVDNTSLATGKYTSMTNDPNGNLHVGYLDTSAAAPLLKYATNRSGNWVLEQVPIPDVTVAGTATVFSENYGPRVMAYAYNTTSGNRKYTAARKWTDTTPPTNDGHWEIQDIAGGFWDPPNNTLPQYPVYNTTSDTFTGATQFGGKTFISYTDGNNLWYANERDYFYFKLDAANSIAGSGKQSDLVLAPNGDIHIVYYTPGSTGSGELRYGTGQGNTEAGYAEAVLVSGVSSDPSITMDGNGALHVSYIQAGRVKYLNGTMNTDTPPVRVWSAPYDLGPCGSAGAYTSIKANGLNIVHLTYYSNNGGGYGTVMYAQRTTDGAWSIPTPVWSSTEPAAGDYGQYATLVVDDHHNVNIAYHDVSQTSLKVATKLIPVITVSPESMNYGAIAPGTQASQTVTVTNKGKSTLKIGTVSMTGNDASLFSITSNACNGLSLAPFAGCSITVSFTSTTTGLKAATLNIPSNDHYTPNKQVALSVNVTEGTLYTINASAGSHGTIAPSGTISVLNGGSQRFDFQAEPGFSISDVKVDGVTNTAAIQDGYYNFTNVTANHTIEVSFTSYVRVGEVFFGTLQAAYDASGTGAPIQARDVFFNEDLFFNMNKEVVFAGGYNSLFSAQTGATLLYGDLEVSSGGVEVENLGLE